MCVKNTVGGHMFAKNAVTMRSSERLSLAEVVSLGPPTYPNVIFVILLCASAVKVLSVMLYCHGLEMTMRSIARYVVRLDAYESLNLNCL